MSRNDKIEIPNYSQRDLRKLLNQISKLSEIEHHGIFKILVQNDLPYTNNNNGLFINMTNIPSNVVYEIEKFVDFCNLNNAELDAHEQKLNDCRQNSYYTISWNQNLDMDKLDENSSHFYDESTKENDDNDDNDKNDKNDENMKNEDNQKRSIMYSTIMSKDFNNLGESYHDYKKKTVSKSKNDGKSDKDEIDNIYEENEINCINHENYSKNDWKNLINEHSSFGSNSIVKTFTSHLEENMDNIHKKKINMKYTNAKKKFARKITVDKKQDFDISNNLVTEDYVL